MRGDWGPSQHKRRKRCALEVATPTTLMIASVTSTAAPASPRAHVSVSRQRQQGEHARVLTGGKIIKSWASVYSSLPHFQATKPPPARRSTTSTSVTVVFVFFERCCAGSRPWSAGTRKKGKRQRAHRLALRPPAAAAVVAPAPAPRVLPAPAPLPPTAHDPLRAPLRRDAHFPGTP